MLLIAESGSALKKELESVPHQEERLDTDLQKMNADPQPWLL